MREPFIPLPSKEIAPYVTAHRGISAKAPENTIAAFLLACATPGIDMIELDVRLTRDEEVIVLHDRTLQRTSTGNGAARQYTYAEIREFDAGSWFHQSFSRERIPLLSDVLEVVDGRLWINIELKSDLFFRERPGLLEQKVLEVVHRHKLARHVLYSSFDHSMVANIKRMDPEATTGVLFNLYRDYGKPPSKLARRVGASVFVCAKHEVTRGMIEDAHGHNIEVYVYTLNSIEGAMKLAGMGVDGILSDCADDIVPHVKQRVEGHLVL
ncbi:MAG: glycerophosphodiester phosphodiesterase family protein [bacterium]